MEKYPGNIYIIYTTSINGSGFYETTINFNKDTVIELPISI